MRTLLPFDKSKLPATCLLWALLHDISTCQRLSWSLILRSLKLLIAFPVFLQDTFPTLPSPPTAQSSWTSQQP